MSCQECGRFFTPRNHHQRFCSRHCRDRYRYRTHKEEIIKRNAEWRQRNPEKVRAHYRRHWRKYKYDPEFRRKRKERYRRWLDFGGGREKQRQCVRKYRAKHKDDPKFKRKRKEQFRVWYYLRGGREKVLAYMWEWYWLRGNREKAIARMKLRYRNRFSVHIGTPINLSIRNFSGQERVFDAAMLEKWIMRHSPHYIQPRSMPTSEKMELERHAMLKLEFIERTMEVEMIKLCHI